MEKIGLACEQLCQLANDVLVLQWVSDGCRGHWALGSLRTLAKVDGDNFTDEHQVFITKHITAE